jgi:hypothetical protein
MSQPTCASCQFSVPQVDDATLQPPHQYLVLPYVISKLGLGELLLENKQPHLQPYRTTESKCRRYPPSRDAFNVKGSDWSPREHKRAGQVPAVLPDKTSA